MRRRSPTYATRPATSSACSHPRRADDPSHEPHVPPDPSGGDEAQYLYDELADDLLYDPAVGRATMMGYSCVRLAGKFLASYDDKNRCLVVELPRERVSGLVDRGRGDPFAPAGRVLREWVAIPTVDRDLWQQLLAEAVEFARRQLAQ